MHVRSYRQGDISSAASVHDDVAVLALSLDDDKVVVLRVCSSVGRGIHRRRVNNWIRFVGNGELLSSAEDKRSPLHNGGCSVMLSCWADT